MPAYLDWIAAETDAALLKGIGGLVAGAVAAAACFSPPAAPSRRRSQPLPPDKAFRFSARLIDARTVEARFMIADGYYLYRDKIHFAIEPATAGLSVPRAARRNGEGRPVSLDTSRPIEAMWSSGSG